MSPSEKPLILVVDDNEAVGRITSQILAAAGYETTVAASGEEAFRLCEECGRPVDLVISDVVMPGISGPELCRQLSLAGRALRCLLISGYSREHLSQTGPQMDSFPMLMKPFNMVQLLDAVRRLLEEPAPERLTV